MRNIITINPATGETLKEWRLHVDSEIEQTLRNTHEAYREWRSTSFKERSNFLIQIAERLEKSKTHLAELAALEMGKPTKDGIAEVEKCATTCRYYAEHGEAMLTPRTEASDAPHSYVRYDPLGVILAIMPWNFPYWQVVRAAAPILMAGNALVLKHASNVPACAEALTEIFSTPIFQSLRIGGAQAENIISDKRIAGVTLTGSTEAGRKVAAAAGKALKPCVLELGGSDPFIVLEDADLDKAAEVAAASRCINSGQSCIAAKRFIITESVYDAFLEKFKTAMEAKTEIGPQAREELRSQLHDQVMRSVREGATIITGGVIPVKKGAWYPPSILANVTPGMAAFDEELFGPVAAVIKAADAEDAVKLANRSRFGLGASLWSRDTKRAEQLAAQIECGAVFINGLVKSDPRLPFGGVKESGFGRELSLEGIRAFTNVKSVWVA